VAALRAAGRPGVPPPAGNAVAASASTLATDERAELDRLRVENAQLRARVENDRARSRRNRRRTRRPTQQPLPLAAPSHGAGTTPRGAGTRAHRGRRPSPARKVNPHPEGRRSTSPEILPGAAAAARDARPAAAAGHTEPETVWRHPEVRAIAEARGLDLALERAELESKCGVEASRVLWRVTRWLRNAWPATSPPSERGYVPRRRGVYETPVVHINRTVGVLA
jgi:hypothetical protein